MILVTAASAQSVTPSLHKNVTLSAGNLRFDRLLHLITQQTGIKFSLNTQKFKPSRIIHVQRGIQRVDELLTEIKNSTGIDYTLLGDHIIFIDRPAVKAVAVSNVVAVRKAGTTTNAAATKNAVTAAKEETGPVFIPNPVGLASTDMRVYPIQADKNSLVKVDTISATPKNQLPRKHVPTPTRSGFFVDAGLMVDETFYVNPSLRAGWPFLYGIAQWSTNFTVSGFRYGVGGALRLNDQWQIGLMATTGVNSKEYPENINGSLPIPITIKTSLQKIGLQAQTKINGHLQLQFGPVLNILSTKYYNPLGTPTPLFVSESDVAEYIKPPYTIRDTYSPISAQNTRIWIGLQAGLFYEINFSKSR